MYIDINSVNLDSENYLTSFKKIICRISIKYIIILSILRIRIKDHQFKVHRQKKTGSQEVDLMINFFFVLLIEIASLTTIVNCYAIHTLSVLKS